MERLVYRNFGSHESLVVTHSVATSAGAGGVRWYEFRLNGAAIRSFISNRPILPTDYRWLASIGWTGEAISGSATRSAEIRTTPASALRRVWLPIRKVSSHSRIRARRGSCLADRQLAMGGLHYLVVDPSDDCTFWFAGNYLKPDAPSSTTRIGSFVLPDASDAGAHNTSHDDSAEARQRKRPRCFGFRQSLPLLRTAAPTENP